MPLITTQSAKGYGWGSLVAPVSDNDYDSIATVILGSAASSITFSSIPSTYKHLQVRLIGRTTRSDYTIEDTNLQINGDTGANYAWHRMFSNPAVPNNTIATNGSSGATYINSVGILSTVAASANMFGAAVIDILDYANTNKLTSVRNFTGTDNNSEANGYAVSGFVELSGGTWLNTAAVTSLTFTNTTGTQLAAGCHFALYGIKG